MTTTTRPARSVLAEHGAPTQLHIDQGDEVFVTLPGDEAESVECCELHTPSGRTFRVDHRLRDAGCGERDAVAVIAARAPGSWSYTWTTAAGKIEGKFHVGRPPQRRGRRGRR